MIGARLKEMIYLIWSEDGGLGSVVFLVLSRHIICRMGKADKNIVSRERDNRDVYSCALFIGSLAYSLGV